jgi:hypothetical protein
MEDQPATARALDAAGRSVGREGGAVVRRSGGREDPPLGFSVRERPRVRARVWRFAIRRSDRLVSKQRSVP